MIAFFSLGVNTKFSQAGFEGALGQEASLWSKSVEDILPVWPSNHRIQRPVFLESKRIGEESYKALREIAERSGESMQGVLAKAIEEYRRESFLEDANVAFAALRKDPEAWRREQEERVAWDVTLYRPRHYFQVDHCLTS